MDDIDEHDMHSEFYQMTEETAELLNEVRKKMAEELLQSVQLRHEHLKRLHHVMMAVFKEESGWTRYFYLSWI